eukprot:TRINITY_DN3508_c0_g1_i4.p2 TRINITY_DN3508_c0_g1~~TRINITY_DN3508_c0_g1_i4.p2  ORF type:complete len:286 (+),score=-11.47 TRINITY_DN3508_c0_g1_i4:80-937(+)
MNSQLKLLKYFKQILYQLKKLNKTKQQYQFQIIKLFCIRIKNKNKMVKFLKITKLAIQILFNNFKLQKLQNYYEFVTKIIKILQINFVLIKKIKQNEIIVLILNYKIILYSYKKQKQNGQIFENCKISNLNFIQQLLAYSQKQFLFQLFIQLDHNQFFRLIEKIAKIVEINKATFPLRQFISQNRIFQFINYISCQATYLIFNQLALRIHIVLLIEYVIINNHVNYFFRSFFFLAFLRTCYYIIQQNCTLQNMHFKKLFFIYVQIQKKIKKTIYICLLSFFCDHF